MKYIDAEPDKIYAGFNENTHLESYCLEKKGECQTEYLRKDTLLEWLNKRIKSMDDSLAVNYLTALAYKDVIDKINSL